LNNKLSAVALTKGVFYIVAQSVPVQNSYLMILTQKSRIAGIVLLLFFASTASAQWSDGAFISIAPQAGVAFNKQVRNYTWAAGGVGKLSIPMGTNDYFTFSVNALSINGKSPEGKALKEHDILSGFIGYRYDFRIEDSYSYFYMEPQIGWTASGTDYNTFSVLPLIGYSLNGKLDIGAWYHASTTTKRLSKIGVGGIMVAYNFHLSRRSGD
jgi:hypothetical protein